MKFDLEEVETDEAQWYLSLTTVEDKVRSLDVLRDPKQSETKKAVKKSKSQVPYYSRTSQRPPAAGPTSKVIAIEEISDDEDVHMEEDDLLPYEKPDSDASDSEEDPTLIQRGKPTAPV
jgi:telomere length regulation protein